MSSSSSSSTAAFPGRKGTTIIAGGTGYIGKSTVRESVRQGYHTVVLVRDLRKVQSSDGRRLYEEFFDGAEIVECDVSDPIQLTKVRTLCPAHPPALPWLSGRYRNLVTSLF
jgi:NAD(P)-dependent dehydrogenase (short-subunit alcohol dehydrogenase family)